MRRAAAVTVAVAAWRSAAARCSAATRASPDNRGTAADVVRTTTTRVEVDRGVVEGFDPRAIYEREAARRGDRDRAVRRARHRVAAGDRTRTTTPAWARASCSTARARSPPTRTSSRPGAGQRSSGPREVYVEFADGNRSTAEIVGYDPNADVALLKIDPRGLELHPLPLGRSARRGGRRRRSRRSARPFGEQQSLSVGVVSAIDRDDRVADRLPASPARCRPTRRSTPATRAARWSTAQGKVIGINPQIQTTSGGGEGVGFAVPVDIVRRSLDQLREDGKADYAYLGVSSQARVPAARRAVRPAGRARRLAAGGHRGRPGRQGGAARGPARERRASRPHGRLPGGDIVDDDRRPRDRGLRRPGRRDRQRYGPATRSRSRSTATASDRRTSRSSSGERPKGAIASAACRGSLGSAAVLQPVARRPQDARRLHAHRRPRRSSRRSATLAEPLQGKRVVHLSATAFGGGVAEILYTLVPLMKDVGLDVEWQVIYGREEFFNATKLMHNALQGNPQDLHREQWATWRQLQRDERARARARLGRRASSTTRSPPRCRRSCPRRPSAGSGAATSTSRRPTRRRWSRLLPVPRDYPAVALPRRRRTCPRALQRRRQHRAAGDRPAGAEEHGALARGRRPTSASSSASTSSRPLMCQVSRFDPWKDPLGVIDAYRLVKEEMPDVAARARRLDGLRRPRGLGLLQRDGRARRRRPGHPHPQQLQQRRARSRSTRSSRSPTC